MIQKLGNVSRPIQLDSYDLDKNFIDLLGSKIEALQIDSLNECSPEIKLFLKIYMWFHKIFKAQSSIGMESYSLQFADSHNKSLNIFQRISFLLEPFTSYFLDRFSDHFEYSSQKNIQKFLALLQTLEVVNYFVFLYNGHYRTLLERLFSIRIFGPQKQYSSNWNKTQIILNRELNWRLISQILTLALPMLLNNRFFKRHILSSLFGRSINIKNPKNCALCSQPTTNTVSISNCLHLYCYACIASEISQYGQFDCLKCSAKIFSMKCLKFDK